MRDFEKDTDGKVVCDDNPGVWLANAMTRPDSFAYFGEDAEDRANMFRTWALGPVIETRDSGFVDKSNAEALRRFLASDASLEDEYRLTECSHWAVGWVMHVSFHAYDSDDDKTKRPTRIARILAAWFTYLHDQYPVADDMLYSEMECEASDKWIKEEGQRYANHHGFTLPENWQSRVYDWWDASDEHRNAREDVDDQGASPSDDDFRAAFEGCAFAKEEEGDHA